MSNYLVDQALRNVWCTPNQNTEVILAPARLTPPAGTVGYFTVMWDQIALPDSTSLWHVYQIGQVHPLILGLLTETNVWISLDQSCNAQNMMCDIYTINGVQIPRFQTYYKWGNNKDLILAVKYNPKLPYSFVNDQIYFRVYSDAYFNSTRTVTGDKIYVHGVQTVTTTDVTNLQNAYYTYADLMGSCYAFVNGIKVSALSLLTMQPGDVGEFVYDSSIYKVVEFQVSSLNTFTSILDSKLKYLLHYSGGDTGSIDYQDNIDVYIVQKYNTSLECSLYYHKNNVDALRMVTHRDYSVVPAYITNYATFMNTLAVSTVPVDPRSLYVRLYIRKGGYFRPLVYESNRIHDLYKMSDAQIIAAMVGVDATVPVWQAANLEASPYCQVMRSQACAVTQDLVEAMYGYNGMAKILGDTPQIPFTYSGQQIVNVPYGLINNSTAYEYDTNGHLMGWYPQFTGQAYACANSTAGLVEFVYGTGSNALDEYYNPTTVTVNTALNEYRVYACHQVAGVPDNIFTDVTGDNTKYTIVGNTFTWISTDTTLYPVLRSDKKILALDFTVSAANGLLQFTLSSLQTKNSITANNVMTIPMGEFDVIMNGKSLVRGLDYFISFPLVVITNTEYLINPATQPQTFHVRGTGFCDSKMNLWPEADSGFVAYGVLSDNFHYDVRDDRVLRIIVDGALRTRSSLSFAETGIGTDTLDTANGKPYQIREIPVDVDAETDEDLALIMQQAAIVNKQVSDYLSIKLPSVNPSTPTGITSLYQIYSPFCSSLINDLATGVLTVPTVTGPYGRLYVTNTVKPYEYLLKVDPTQPATSVDSNYVTIAPINLPGTMTLSPNAYKFMLEVLTYYTNSLVSLSAFITVS